MLSNEFDEQESRAAQPMTLDEFNDRIDRSEDDFQAGNFKPGKALLKKFE